MKTLEQIQEEVGTILLLKWKADARRSMRPCFWNHAEARNAAEYGHVLKAYESYIEIRRASEMAGRVC
jgi:hypothetical protein